MGFLHYGGDVYPMDDRTLLHVQIAVHEVARHKPAFYLTWVVPRELGGGRLSAWVTPGVPLLFAFDGGRVARVNRAWVEHLVEGALAGRGIVVVPEPAEHPAAAPAPAVEVAGRPE
ncbi:MAG: hypothetical protein JWR01_366 [Subtercola sp.]|jgi:hypothetical protein|nr:hypothetical protein [Subtercola sp.]